MVRAEVRIPGPVRSKVETSAVAGGDSHRPRQVILGHMRIHPRLRHDARHQQRHAGDKPHDYSEGDPALGGSGSCIQARNPAHHHCGTCIISSGQYRSEALICSFTHRASSPGTQSCRHSPL